MKLVMVAAEVMLVVEIIVSAESVVIIQGTDNVD